MEELFVRAPWPCTLPPTATTRRREAMLVAIDELNQVSLEYPRPRRGAAVDRAAAAARRRRRPQPAAVRLCLRHLLERGLIANEAWRARSRGGSRPASPPTWGPAGSKGWRQRNRYALLARQPLWEQLAAYIARWTKTVPPGAGLPPPGVRPLQAREKRQIRENLGEFWELDADAPAR